MKGMSKTVSNGSLPKQCDVAIVGSGPAGLATAIELKKLGVEDIIVLERADEAGGNPRHCGHSPFGFTEFKRPYLGPGYAKKMVDVASKLGVKIALNTTVTALGKNALLTLSTIHGIAQLRAKKVVLSTGIREMPRAPRFVSGQRPQGILTTGALQSMVYLSHKKPFKRPIIIGSELVSFSAIASCRHASIKPVAIIEENERITALSILQLFPRVLGIDVLLGTQLVEITGRQQVTGVNVRSKAGHTEHIACDGVIFTGKFTPEASLARMGHLDIDPNTQGPVVDQFGRCSDPDYFATGNVLRPVETGGWCWNEGVQTAKYVKDCLLYKLPEVDNQRYFQIASTKIKYVLPQRVSIPADRSEPQGMQDIQLRVTTPVSGRISINSDNTEFYTKKITALPERRLLIPMQVLSECQRGQELTINFTPGN